MLVQPATAETVAAFMDAAEAAPEELSAIVNVMPCPPLPFVAEEHHGSLVIFALMCFAGEADAGEAAMAPFRAVAQPLGDLVRPMTYPELFPAEEHPPAEEGADPAMVPGFAGLTLFTDPIGADEAALIVGRLDGRTRRCGSRSSASSAARWPGWRPTPPPSRTGSDA